MILILLILMLLHVLLFYYFICFPFLISFLLVTTQILVPMHVYDCSIFGALYHYIFSCFSLCILCIISYIFRFSDSTCLGLLVTANPKVEGFFANLSRRFSNLQSNNKNFSNSAESNSNSLEPIDQQPLSLLNLSPSSSSPLTLPLSSPSSSSSSCSVSQHSFLSCITVESMNRLMRKDCPNLLRPSQSHWAEQQEQHQQNYPDDSFTSTMSNSSSSNDNSFSYQQKPDQQLLFEDLISSTKIKQMLRLNCPNLFTIETSCLNFRGSGMTKIIKRRENEYL